MDHARENGEVYSNSVSIYFLNANFVKKNNIILVTLYNKINSGQ